MLALEAVWRDAQTLLEVFLGLVRGAPGRMHRGQAVKQRRQHRELADGRGEDLLCTVQFAALQPVIAQHHQCPGHGAVGDQTGEQRFQFGMLAERLERAGLVAQTLRGKPLVARHDLLAGGQNGILIALGLGIENRLERQFALHQFVQALLQAGPVEGLGQVGIRLAFQGAHHHGLAALGSTHDENAVGADQTGVVQLFEDLLAVLAGTQVVIVQNHVIGRVAAHGNGLFPAGGGVDILHGHEPQHSCHRRTKLGEVIYHQEALFTVVDHMSIRSADVFTLHYSVMPGASG